MCAIAGVISQEQITEKEINNVGNMLKIMKHRGPDGSRVETFINAVFGHNRLSIIDLNKRSSQPFSYLNKRYWIVFNGEIYNYLEVKNILIKNGYLFNTTSDTEVILAAYDKWGIKSFNKFNGMFAFCIFDRKTSEYIIVRDRFGVKPLYYLVKEKKMFFASEIKSFLGVTEKFKINNSAIKEFVKYTRSDYKKSTFITDIKQIQGGHYIRLKKNNIDKVRQMKWYYGSDYKIDDCIFSNKQKTLEYIENLLIDAIRIRYRSDVPVCLTLSGGIDSTVIYILTKEKINNTIIPFTYRHIGSKTDEYNIVKRLTQHYKDKVNIVYCKNKVSISELKKSMYFLEFPIWNPSGIAYFDMYKKIKDNGYKVVLEGHGSDEQFGGYPYMIEEAWKEKLNNFNIIDAWKIFEVYRNTENSNLIKNSIFKKSMLIRFLKYYFDKFIKKDKRIYSFDKTVNNAFNKDIIPMVLRTFDRLSMSNSIESRSPYMDYRVVEFVKKMPLKYKIDKIGSKAILREILKKYGFDYIYKNKKKTGFSIDVPKFVNQKLIKKFFIECIKMSNINYKGIDMDKLKAIIQKNAWGWSDIEPIWKIVSISLIKKNYE